MIERNASRTEVEHLIDEWVMGRNAERNREILKRRWCDGITYEGIAEEFALSVRQVKNIVYKSEQMLIKRMKKGKVR